MHRRLEFLYSLNVARAVEEPARPLFFGCKPCLPAKPLLIGFVEGDNTLHAFMKVLFFAPHMVVL